jgi:hypothetical protein
MATNLLSNTISDIYKGILHTTQELSGNTQQIVYDGAGNETSMQIGLSGVTFNTLDTTSLSSYNLLYPTEVGAQYSVLAQSNNTGMLGIVPLSEIICNATNGINYSAKGILDREIMFPTLSCGIITDTTQKPICDIYNNVGVLTHTSVSGSIPKNQFVAGISLTCGLIKSNGISYETANVDPKDFVLERDKFYFLSTDKDIVDEGETFTIRLRTIDVPDFEKVSYRITGVTSDDIDGAALTGEFDIINNVSTITFTTSINEDVIGVPNETFKIELTNLPSYSPPAFAHVDIISDLRLKDHNRICIAIIDETSYSNHLIQNDYDTFVANHPNREFHLITGKAAHHPGRGWSPLWTNLTIPAGFANNPNFFIHGFRKNYLTNNRQTITVGEKLFTWQGSGYDRAQDWFNLANLSRVYRGSTIYFAVDNSGSTTTNFVRGQYDNFIAKCTAHGLKAKELNMFDERYIKPFIGALPD